eukprot:m.1475175 g.1475175  ORF g.1475175 m.1475175 type:complete len:2147 (-) comp25155_c0_seq15:836-7276(-)
MATKTELEQRDANAFSNVCSNSNNERSRTSSISPKPLPNKCHMSGWGEKIGGRVKSWKKRYFVLSDVVLRYYTEKNEVRPKGILNLLETKSIRAYEGKSVGCGLGIGIEQRKRTYILRFKEQDIRDVWLGALVLRWEVARNEQQGVQKGEVPPLLREGLQQPKQSPINDTQDALASAPTAVEDSLRTSRAGCCITTQDIVHISADTGAARSLELVKVRDVPALEMLPRHGAVGLTEAIHRLVRFNSIHDSSGAEVLAVRGPRGSGKSTLLRTVQQLMETHSFTDPLAGFRVVFWLLCPQCRRAEFAADDMTELYTHKDSTTGEVTTQSGRALDTSATCHACATVMSVQRSVFGEDEIVLLRDNFPLNRDPALPATMMHCTHCDVTGFAMTPGSGLCVDHGGVLLSVTGERMPPISEPCWQLSLPQLSPGCSTGVVEPVPVVLGEAQVQRLVSLFPTGVHVRAVSPVQPLSAYINCSQGGSVLELSAGVVGRLYDRFLNYTTANASHDQINKTVLDPELTYQETQACMAKVGVPVNVLVLDHLRSLQCRAGEDNVSCWFPARLQQPSGHATRIVVAVDDDDADLMASLRHVCTTRGFALEELAVPSAAPSVALLQTLADGVAEELRVEPWPLHRLSAMRDHVNAHPMYTRFAQGLARLGVVPDADWTPPASFDAVVDQFLNALEARFDRRLVGPWLVVCSLSLEGCPPETLREVFQRLPPGESVAYDADKIAAATDACRGVVLTRGEDIRYLAVFLSDTLRDMVQQRYGNAHALQRVLFQAAVQTVDNWSLHKASLLRYRGVFGTPTDAYELLCDWSVLHELAQMSVTAYVLHIDDWLRVALPAAAAADWQRRLTFFKKNVLGLASTRFRNVVMKFDAADEDNELRHVITGHRVQAQLPKKLCRIFTSSTFDDLKVERDALMQRAYPLIRRKCQDLGIEFQVVDMRWGIRDESTDDHQTTAICMREIEQCQQNSIGPNFITFLSQRYGYRPFPAEIEREEFDALVARISPDATAVLQKWFKLDMNCVPPMYILQPVSALLPAVLESGDARAQAKSAWWNAFETMGTALRTAARELFGDTEPTRKYVFSVTENEIRQGLLALDDDARRTQCMWFKRNIVDLAQQVAAGDAAVGKFTDLKWGQNEFDPDARELLDSLRGTELPAALPSALVHEFDVTYAPGIGIDPEHTPAHATYIDSLVSTFVEQLSGSITAAVDRSRINQRNPFFDEIFRHVEYAHEVAQGVLERSTCLRRLQEYIRGSHTLPLVVYGPSGCGKTALLAQCVAATVANSDAGVAVVCRFAGLTQASTNLDDLLASVHSQLCVLFDVDDEVPASTDQKIAAVKRLLARASASRKIILVLDSLDQLSDAGHGRLVNRWLPVHLNPHCKVIVSTVDDKAEVAFPAACKLLWGQPDFASSFYRVPALTVQEADTILRQWLATDHRTLTPAQHDAVLQAFAPSASPLFLRLAFDLSSTWKSYSPGVVLPTTIQGLIDIKITQMERTHGRVFLARALSYLTVSRDGLSTTELEDVLSLDEDALDDVFQYWVPPIRRLPPLLWVRARRDLGEYLLETTSTGASTLRWAHRQFRTMVQERYLGHAVSAPPPQTTATDLCVLLADATSRMQALTVTEPAADVTPQQKAAHAHLSEYFSGQWSETDKPDKTGVASLRQVAAMPYLLQDRVNAYTGDYERINERKARELPYHLQRAGNTHALHLVLTEPAILNYYGQHKKFAELSVLWATEPNLRAVFAAYTAAAERMAKGMAQYRFCTFVVGFAQTANFSDAPALAALHRLMDDNISVGGALRQAEGSVQHLEARALLHANRIPDAVALVNATLTRKGIHVRVMADLLFVRGECFRAVGDINHAVADFLAVKDMAVKHLSNLPVLYCSVLNALGLCYQRAQQYQMAINTYKEALTYLQTTFGTEDENYATVCTNLAALLLETRSLDDAEQYFAQAISIRQQVLGSQHPSVGEALSNMGTFLVTASHFGQPRYNEALGVYERAVEIYTVADTHNKEANMLKAKNGLAHVMFRTGRVDDAMELMNQVEAECASSTTLVEKDEMLAQYAGNNGVFLLETGRHTEALPKLMQSLAYKESTLPANHPDIGNLCKCVACAYHAMGQQAECAKYVERFKAIQQHHQAVQQKLVH